MLPNEIYNLVSSDIENFTIQYNGYDFYISYGKEQIFTEFTEAQTNKEVLEQFGNACSALMQYDFLWNIVNGRVK